MRFKCHKLTIIPVNGCFSVVRHFDRIKMGKLLKKTKRFVVLACSSHLSEQIKCRQTDTISI